MPRGQPDSSPDAVVCFIPGLTPPAIALTGVAAGTAPPGLCGGPRDGDVARTQGTASGPGLCLSGIPHG